ncbi:MAG: hypothetical protein SPH77_08115, partial [Campylobacter sp.]
ASEAVLNRIPVLVAKNGGLEEAMAGAGIALDVPSTLHDDPARMPSDEEIAPWLEALKQLLKAKKAATSSIKLTASLSSSGLTAPVSSPSCFVSSSGLTGGSHPELSLDEWKAAESSEWQARFDEAAKLLDIERSTDRTMAMLEPLFAKRASQNPHIMLKGQLRFGFDGNPY